MSDYTSEHFIVSCARGCLRLRALNLHQQCTDLTLFKLDESGQSLTTVSACLLFPK